jgi:phosphatidylethanolamine-binding protein (PEBP) family uncharacterized protein
VDNATLSKLTLTSTAFEDGQPIPRQYTCDGADRIPAPSWDEPPAGTRSFALVVDTLGLGAGAGVADVEAAAGKQALATGELIGTYERK